MATDLIVVKVGGSLFDLPDLGPRLRRWLATLSTPDVLLVPGGGRAADLVRELDRCHQLGEERAHWLALQAMSLNAQLLTLLLPGSRIVADWAAPEEQREIRVLDAYRFARADEARPGHLPHSWHATSDSVAARAAVVAGARELILLKSIAIPPDIDWTEAGWHGFIDPLFAEVIRDGLRVRAINFRDWRP